MVVMVVGIRSASAGVVRMCARIYCPFFVFLLDSSACSSFLLLSLQTVAYTQIKKCKFNLDSFTLIQHTHNGFSKFPLSVFFSSSASSYTTAFSSSSFSFHS